MSFTYPLGLLGLIGIPVVILIYILRSKFNEQTVSSTYLWELSEKFLKRKNPLSGLTGIISLILQILTISVISIAIAHPTFVLAGAANDYCFVLDTSGSMNMTEGKETRLDMAKSEITDIIKSAADGSTYSLTCVSDEAAVIFTSVSNKDTAISMIEEINGDYSSSTTARTVKIAQRYFDDNTSAFVYIVTDKIYNTVSNIRLIRVGESGKDNYAISDTAYTHTLGTLSVTGSVTSYASDKDITVNLYVDGSDTPSASATVSAQAGVPTDVSLQCQALRFSSFKVEVANEDGYAADNTQVIHNLKSEKTYNTLVVSETGFFFRAIIDTLLDSDVTVITPDEYPTHEGNYGLYIFDSYTPDALPNGAVWLVNSDRSVENSGFSVRGRNDFETSDTIKKSPSTASSVRKLLRGVEGDNIYISGYVKYSGMYLNFNTLFTYDSNPLIFAGTNGIGYRQVVFGFNIHESDIALSTDFIMLMRNLLEYSFPDILDDTVFTVGEEVAVNVIAGAENIKAFAPSGKEIYAENDGSVARFKLDEIGTYTVSATVSGEERKYNIYSGAHPDESSPTVTEESFALSGEQTFETRDGRYDPSIILYICLAVLFIADWGVFCYEKYQLR